MANEVALRRVTPASPSRSAPSTPVASFAVSSPPSVVALRLSAHENTSPALRLSHCDQLVV